MAIDRDDESTGDFLDKLGFSIESNLCEPIPRGFCWEGKEICLTGFFHVARENHSRRLPVVVKLLKGVGARVTENWRVTMADVVLVGQRFNRLKKITRKITEAKENNELAKQDLKRQHIYIFSERAVLARLKIK